MSSIYQKGRDGYFYYQTYVYNKSTGKKDKKVFHALKTKDREEAELKQKKLGCVLREIHLCLPKN